MLETTVPEPWQQTTARACPDRAFDAPERRRRHLRSEETGSRPRHHGCPRCLGCASRTQGATRIPASTTRALPGVTIAPLMTRVRVTPEILPQVASGSSCEADTASGRHHRNSPLKTLVGDARAATRPSRRSSLRKLYLRVQVERWRLPRRPADVRTWGLGMLANDWREGPRGR